MAYKVKEVIESLDYEELLKLKNDIDGGAVHIKRLIAGKIREKEKEHGQYCATCSSEINPKDTNSYTLVFGPESFRKKASFDGLDCLEYFIAKLKKAKNQ